MYTCNCTEVVVSQLAHIRNSSFELRSCVVDYLCAACLRFVAAKDAVGGHDI